MWSKHYTAPPRSSSGGGSGGGMIRALVWRGMVQSEKQR